MSLKTLFALTALPLAACFCSQAQTPSVADLARPTPQQAAWHDLEVGMFIHLAPQTWQDSESDTMATPLSAINPEKLDTDQWTSVAASMGAKYIVFVAKHEGGFCWWPTATTDYSVKSTPWRGGNGDVLHDLADSCRARGIKLGVYLSPQDRKFGAGIGGKCADASKQAAYESMFRKQLIEVLKNYGPMMEVWFDGSLVFDVGDILLAYASDAVVFQGPQATIRWVGNEDGIAPDPAWNAVKHGAKEWGGYTAADGDPEGDRWLPNECDARIRATWFWKTNNENTLKSVDQLMDMYERSVGHGAVLLLNNTPDRTGLIPQADARRSAEFGDAVRKRYGRPAAETGGRDRVHTLKLESPVTIDRAVVAEEITRGERVRKYVIEGEAGGVWKELCSGTAVGHKKIDRFAPVGVTTVRLRVTDSVGEPYIRAFAVFQAPEGALQEVPAGQPVASAPAHSAVKPEPRPDDWWKQRNDSFNMRATMAHPTGDIGLIFLGDSITQGWEGEGQAVWEKYYGARQAVNFGIGGDRTQHVLWRIENGNLDGLDKPLVGSPPKLVVLMIGTNNSNGNDNTAEEIADGIRAIVGQLRARLPHTKVLLLAIFPRNEKPEAQRAKNAKASQLASAVADDKMVYYLDIGPKFLTADGTLTREIMPDLLHLSPKGYEIWAEAIEPKVRELMDEK